MRARSCTEPGTRGRRPRPVAARTWSSSASRSAASFAARPGEFQVSDPAGGASLYFMKVPEPKAGKNRLHLDLVTSGPMEAEVARLAEAGAEVVEVRQDPASLDNPDTWTVMRDPEGHEFCVSSTATLTGWA
jgi:hypothetical protein